jgi:hypothetical protein
VVFGVGLLIFGAWPIWKTWLPDHAGIWGWFTGFGQWILLFAIANLLYALGVDLLMDLRGKHRRMPRILLHSGVSTGLFGAIAGVLMPLLWMMPWDPIPWMLAVYGGLVLWQWIVEAAHIRFNYGSSTWASVAVEIVSRCVSTVLAFILFSKFAGEFSQLLQRFS